MLSPSDLLLDYIRTHCFVVPASLHCLYLQANAIKMKYFVAALLVAYFAALVSSQKPLSLETIDLDSTLKNDKLVRRHIDCVLDKGRCDNNGTELKSKPFNLI